MVKKTKKTTKTPKKLVKSVKEEVTEAVKVTKSVKKAVKETVKETVKEAVKAGETKSGETKSVTPVEKKEVSLSDAFSDLLGQLASLRTQLTAVTSQTRSLAKRSEREIRVALKQSRRRPRKGSAPRQPSGFVKPTLISEELAMFLGKVHGVEMARTQVTREINVYIRAHDLQDPKNGRVILPDPKLRKLLAIKKGEELTYFNLQRYMSPHFAKSGKNVVQPVPVATSS
mgnify:CR=1 FL=1